MFDWNEEDDGVTDTIWDGFEEGENQTVAYHKLGENGAQTVGDSWKHKQENKQNSTSGTYIEKSTFEPDNELPGCNFDTHSHFHAEESFSGSGYQLDSCSNFPFIDTAVKVDNIENDHGSTSSTMVNDLSLDYSKNSRFTENFQSGDVRPSSYEGIHEFGELKLDSEPGIFSSGNGQKEVDSFLDCDWGSIQDFDDLDELFSGSIFGHETTSNVDELLSPADSTNTTTSPFPTHETLMSVNVPTEKALSFLEKGKSSGKRKRPDCNKLDKKKVSLKPHMELEEKSAVLENSQVQQFKYAPPAALPSFRPSVFPPPQVQMGAPHFLGYFPYGHQAFTGYGYPAFSFPSLPHPVQATSQQSEPAQLCNVHPQNHVKHISSLHIPHVASRMTPEEKIEKLRWRQQMQAMLAIKQQGKQFGDHVGTADAPLNPRIPQKSQSRKSCLSTRSKVEEQEESHFTNVTSKCTLQETMFLEFQETLMKLDDNLRVCMKESLYRLARNASDRHCAKNRSNAHFSITKDDVIFENEAINFPDRSSAAIDVETNTNPVDRAVANLLFHSPQNSSVMVVKEDEPESKESISYECISKAEAKCGGKIKRNGTL